MPLEIIGWSVRVPVEMETREMRVSVLLVGATLGFNRLLFEGALGQVEVASTQTITFKGELCPRKENMLKRGRCWVHKDKAVNLRRNHHAR